MRARSKLAELSRDFAKESGIQHFYDANVTILHTKFYRDLVQPGEVVLGADSHTSSHGGLGAFAIGLGGADVTAAMVLGQTWIEVPEAIAVEYNGATALRHRRQGRHPAHARRARPQHRRDGAHRRVSRRRGAQLHHRHALHDLQHDGGVRRPERHLRAGRAGRGVAAAPPTRLQRRRALLPRRRRRALRRALPDRPRPASAPQIAKPFSPDNVFAVEELVGQELDGCFIGACTTTEEELVLGALVLEQALADGAEPQPVESGRRIVVPGDLMIQKRFQDLGLWEIYERAGFIVDPPSCSMCLGVASRKAGKGEVWLSSQNRNFENRMGEGSLAWLASAATVAASALSMRVDRPAPAAGAHRPRPAGHDPAAPAQRAAASRSRSRSRRSNWPRQRAGAERQAIRRRRHPRAGAALRRLRRHRRDHPRRVLPPHRPDELGEKAFYYVRPEFRQRAKDGATIVVAGEGWGTGSSREQAVWALQGTGIQAVIARSFAFIHKRNLVNEALPYLVIRDEAFYDLATEGAELEVDLASGVVRDVASGREFQAQTPTPMIQALTAEGGLVKAIQTHGKDVFAALTA